jgi:D-arabinose 1-dehydrogenase-like Zn-dependent alcohol dehydrogenase
VVTAFTTRLNNLDSLRQLGANDAQHSTDEQQLAKNEGQFDVVVSTLYIDNPTLYKAHQRLTKPGGVYIMLGAPNSHAKYELDTEYLVSNEITVAGSNVGSIDDVKDMLEFSAHYGVKSTNEHFSFEDFPKALHRAEKETPRYRCVVNVTDWAKKHGFDK